MSEFPETQKPTADEILRVETYQRAVACAADVHPPSRSYRTYTDYANGPTRPEYCECGAFKWTPSRRED